MMASPNSHQLIGTVPTIFCGRVSACPRRCGSIANSAPRRLVLWCEAVGMAPQLARIADPYGITVMSSGGFDSLTDKHRVPGSWAGQAITVLHIGDHDPSGVSMQTALLEDIIAFGAEYAADIEAVRVAVTLEQAREFGLPTARPIGGAALPTAKPCSARRSIPPPWRASSRARSASASIMRSIRRDSMRKLKPGKTCLPGFVGFRQVTAE